jgi:hypothetical protein
MFNFLKSGKKNKEKEKNEEKKKAEAEIILKKIIAIKEDILLNKKPTLADFNNLIKEQDKLRDYGSYLHDYNIKNKEQNSEVNDLLIEVVPFENLFLEYTRNIYSDGVKDVNPDQLELDNVKTKKPLYEQIYFYETRYNDDTSYKYKLELDDAIKRENEELEKMDDNGKKIYGEERQKFIEKKKTEYGEELEKLNLEKNLEIEKFTSEEDKKIIKDIESKPLYEQIKLYNDHTILIPGHQAQDQAEVSTPNTYSNRFDSLISIAKKMEQNLINVHLYDANNKEYNKEYINKKKLFQEKEKQEKEAQEKQEKEEKEKEEQEKEALIEKKKNKESPDELYNNNNIKTGKKSLEEDGMFLQKEITRDMSPEEAQKIGKENYEKRIKEKEKNLNTCKEKFKSTFSTYQKNQLVLFNLFDSIKDELNTTLKNQFENLNIVQEKINECHKSIEGKIDIIQCGSLLSKLNGLLPDFDKSLNQFNKDVYNYIGNTFAKQLKILELYAKELDDIVAANPDPTEFLKVVGADYNTIEINIYKSRSIIDNKFRKFEDFIKKSATDPAFSKLIEIFTKTEIVLKSSGHPPPPITPSSGNTVPPGTTPPPSGTALSFENTCIYNPKNPRNIYHIIPETKKEDFKNISTGNVKDKDKSSLGVSGYNKIIFTDDTSLKTQLNELFTKISNCDENILIFCSSLDVDISKYMNSVLENINKSLFNVTIIHETNDSDRLINMIYDESNNPLTRKITNVFPQGVTLNLHKIITEKIGDFYSNKTYSINLPISGEKNDVTYEKTDKAATVKGQKGGEYISKVDNLEISGGGIPGNIFVQLRDTSLPKPVNDLKELWWYKWYNNVPPCASGRLMQISGTCWFNAGLNIVLLSPTLSKFLIMQLYKLDQETQERFMKDDNFNRCFNLENPDATYSIKDMLYLLVYHILIKNKRISYDKGNIAQIMAARIGDLYKDRQKNNPKDPKKIKKPFTQEEINKKVKEDFYKIDDNMKDAESGDPGNGMKILLESIIPDDFATHLSGDELITGNNPLKRDTKKIDISRDQFAGEEVMKEPPNILLIDSGTEDKFKNVPRTINITVEGITEEYILEAATLGVDGVHAIAGLMCNDIPYIYDSNNVIATSDWTDDKYTEYIKAVKEQGITTYAKDVNSMKGLSTVLYIKSSFKKYVEAYNLAPPKVNAAAPIETPLVTPTKVNTTPPATEPPPTENAPPPEAEQATPGTEQPPNAAPPKVNAAPPGAKPPPNAAPPGAKPPPNAAPPGAKPPPAENAAQTPTPPATASQTPPITKVPPIQPGIAPPLPETGTELKASGGGHQKRKYTRKVKTQNTTS